MLKISQKRLILHSILQKHLKYDKNIINIIMHYMTPTQPTKPDKIALTNQLFLEKLIAAQPVRELPTL
jgi:hypothetical protein